MAVGASLDHTHSQLIALPEVPKRVQEEIEGALRHYQYKERCIYCDIVRQDAGDGSRAVWETDQFLVPAHPHYNAIIHTAPIQQRLIPHYHWHIELMPKLTRTAGFEWGTGFYINPTPPELSAELLRDSAT